MNAEETDASESGSETKATSELSLIKDQISELSMRKKHGQLVEKEDVKSGTVDIEVFKKYLAKFGPRGAVFVTIFQTLRYGLWLGENLWLADWSDSAKLINSTDPDAKEPIDIGVRLGVYTGFGLLQTVFVVIITLTMAKGGLEQNEYRSASVVI